MYAIMRYIVFAKVKVDVFLFFSVVYFLVN